MDCYFEPYIETDYKKVSNDEIENLNSMLESLFLFAFTWSFLCTVDTEGREKINTWFRELTKDVENAMPVNEGTTIYDYYYDLKEKTFKEWS